MIDAKQSITYSAGLTGEPFLFHETRTLAALAAQGMDLAEVRRRNMTENLILHKKASSLKQLSGPIFRRLAVLSPATMQLFAAADSGTARLILLVAIAKTNRLVRDFLTDIYADKLTMKASSIDRSDIERYFEAVYEAEPYLRERTDQTKNKLKQQLMKIVAEAGLVTKSANTFVVTRPHVTSALADRLRADGDASYLSVLGAAV